MAFCIYAPGKTKLILAMLPQLKFNKMKLKVFLAGFCILGSAAAFAQPNKLVADKIIAVVGNKIVLKSDIDNSLLDMQRQGVEIPADARCMTLQQSMGIKALVLQAEKDSLPVTDEEVEADIENQVRYFISQYGSKDELERVAGKSVYQLKEDFKEGFRDRKLAAGGAAQKSTSNGTAVESSSTWRLAGRKAGLR